MSEVLQRFEPLFNPKSVVLVGASAAPLKWGFRILLNLLNGGFKGEIYPVNPHQKEILGLTTYPAIADLPQTPDLAMIVVPPRFVPQAIRECVDKGIKAGVVITAGFAEVGEEEERFEREAVRIAREGRMILVGPNCNGVMCPGSNLYALMPPIFPQPGSLGVITQSGNVGTSIMKRAIARGIGVSRYVSTGNEGDLHCEDYLEYLKEDAETKVIVTYIEGIKSGRRLFEVAKEVTRRKPVIALKVGATQAGAKAARSHTGALAGFDSTFDALCKQAGILRARDIDELFYIAAGFLGQPLPRGRRVGIVTGGGGWGVLASEACAKVGLEVVDLPEEALKELNSFLPSWWSHSNPVDLVAGLNETDVRNSLEVLLRCPEVDGVVFLAGIRPLWQLGITLGDSSFSSPYAEWYKSISELMRQRGTEDFIEMVEGLIAQYKKPLILAAEMIRAPGKEDEGFLYYPSPDHAALVMASLAEYSEYLRENAGP